MVESFSEEHEARRVDVFGAAEEVGLALGAQLEIEQGHIGRNGRRREACKTASASAGGTSPFRIPCHLISRSRGHSAVDSVSCHSRRRRGQSVSRTAMPPSAKSPPWSILPLSS